MRKSFEGVLPELYGGGFRNLGNGNFLYPCLIVVRIWPKLIFLPFYLLEEFAPSQGRGSMREAVETAVSRLG